jgi:isopenicillin N synthase-like dioxygenase
MDLHSFDFSKFVLGNELERVEFSQTLIESLRKHGFVRLVNHGFPDELVQAVFSWVSL